jgi:hypothetical protein
LIDWRIYEGAFGIPDLQIAMRDPKIDRICATRRFGAVAVLSLRAIEKIRAGRMTASEAARHFEQMARTHRLRETGHYDPKLVDMLIARLRQSREEGRSTWGEGD